LVEAFSIWHQVKFNAQSSVLIAQHLFFSFSPEIMLVCSGWPTPPSEVKALVHALALVAMVHHGLSKEYANLTLSPA
jgi:hypothetical protein